MAAGPGRLDLQWRGSPAHPPRLYTSGPHRGAVRTRSDEAVEAAVSPISFRAIARAWHNLYGYSVTRGQTAREDGWYLSFGPGDDHAYHIHLIISSEERPGRALLKLGVEEIRPGRPVSDFMRHGDTPEDVARRLHTWAVTTARRHGILDLHAIAQK